MSDCTIRDCTIRAPYDTITESPHLTCLTAVTPAEDSEEKRVNNDGEEMEIAMDEEGANKPGAEI